MSREEDPSLGDLLRFARDGFVQLTACWLADKVTGVSREVFCWSLAVLAQKPVRYVRREAVLFSANILLSENGYDGADD